MAENSKIEWTDHTFNPWMGCTKVSPGCDHCYAETLTDTRWNKVKWGPHGTRSVTAPNYWKQPEKWNREAEAAGVRRRVFCCSLADVFENWKGPMIAGWGECKGSAYVKGPNGELHLHGYICKMRGQCADWPEATMDDFRAWLFSLIEQTPNLDWLLLTKRPQLVIRQVPESWRKEFPPNVWLGTSTENQEEAERRIPCLLKCPAKVRFLSVEPMIGPVDLCSVPAMPINRPGEFCGIHWAIVGGESGPGKRPMDLSWARSIRGQCKAAGVPFFMKQIDKVQPIPDDLMIREFPL